MDLQEIFNVLSSEYNNKTWSDEFLKPHITLLCADQIICWFELDEDDEGFEEKRDSTISFYDEVVRFLVDRFGEEFKYEDPRISDDYIDRNNIHGQYEIVLDDDGESPAVIAIWENEENEENEMKSKFNENKKIVKEGAKGKNELTEDAILDAIPVDARDGLIDINEPDGSFGRYTWYVKFAPFSDEEAKEAANGIKEVTGRRTQVAGFGREIYVLIMDYPSRPTSESKKLVKEGAGAGYTVTIKGLKFGKILSKKIVPDEYYGYYECQVEILPGEYEIAAEDYYNDFFWQEHEFGETPTARIDGGVATVVYSKQWEDDEQAEDDLAENVENKKLDISFDYGAGWMHADLPREKIEADHVDVENDGYYAGIDKIELNAPDLADAVNSGHASIFDRDEEEEEEEQVNEVSGWKLEDEDLTLVNSESDGDKLYIVKLWWGSGYSLDCYNAYAFSEEEALNYVVAYLEKESPELLKATDEYAQEDEDSFIYVDATMEGANEPHYVWAENLAIAEYPQDHDYPMSKDVKRMNESDYAPLGRRKPRKSDESRRIGESYDDAWTQVGAAFDEFRQRLWRYTRKDRENRMEFYQDCMRKCEEALKTYYDVIVADD